MKVISCLFIIVFSVVAQNLPQFPNKIGQLEPEQPSSPASSPRSISDYGCWTSKVAECDDCFNIRYCDPSVQGETLTKKLCPQAAPYCVNSLEGARCSSKPQFSSCQSVGYTKCTSEGYFANPFDCHSFYFCYKSSPMSDVYERARYNCPSSNYVYSEEIEDCKAIAFETNSTMCRTMTCDKSNIGLVSYRPDGKQNYGLCEVMDSWMPTVSMFKCPEHTEFTGDGCRFKCEKEGRYAVGEVYPRKYYECYYPGSIGGGLTYQTRDCPMNFYFNSTTSNCKLAM